MSSKKPETMGEIVRYWGMKGLSNRSIAAKCNMTLSEFIDALNTEEHGIKPLQILMDQARAEFEAIRVEAKDQLMNSADTSNGLRYKIIREDLKTLEEWAPATRAVKVTVEKAPTEFSFESFTPEELAKIVDENTDNEPSPNDEETDTKD